LKGPQAGFVRCHELGDRRELYVGTVLLGWELGDGLGHVTKLLEVARGLAACGHDPVLVLKDYTVARPLLREVPFPILQAPIAWHPVPKSFVASSYADILAIKGFADPDGLALLIGAWQALIDLTRADLVICDFAPTLCLAAYGVLPTVVIGIGFAVPPALGRDFPPFGPPSGVTISPDRLLENAREVQRRRGRPVPETLPALVGGSARFVHTIEEIDAYRGRRRDAIVEPLQRPGPPLPPAPPDSYFAYLNAEYPGVDLILSQLAADGFRGEAYVRGASSRLLDAARRSGVTIHEGPIALDRALATAAVVIHHGGLNTAESALAAGRPQLTLPIHLEHILTARALEGLGVGRSLLGHYRVDAISASLHELARPGEYSRRAMDFAGTVRARDYPGCLPKIIDCCHAWLS
jgi:rhamnosyltransferase subunit B